MSTANEMYQAGINLAQDRMFELNAKYLEVADDAICLEIAILEELRSVVERLHHTKMRQLEYFEPRSSHLY
jgi:hypothetical protein